MIEIKEIKAVCDMCGGKIHFKGKNITQVECDCGMKYDVVMQEPQQK